MWTAISLSQLGTWDGNCIYKIKDGSRRCKLSAGGDTDIRRFGNRNELIAKITRGVSLTRQEKGELAQGLCCLRWHSTRDIAREICEIWTRVPATVIVPLPSQQSEIQRLKAENEMLATQLQSATAMEKHYYESWVSTFPQLKSLRAEIKELNKTLEETRQVGEVSEDGKEVLTANFDIRRNRVLPKGTFGVPAVTAETSKCVTPVKHTIISKFETPANTKTINSYSLEDSGYFSHASTPDRIFSAKKAYSASPTRRPRASSSDSLIRVENGHKDFALGAPDLSPLTPFSDIITKFEVAKFPSNVALNLNKLSPCSCIVTPTLASSALESTGRRDLRMMGPLEVSSPPMDSLLEKLLKNFLGVVIFFCWAGNLSFVQFTGLVIWTSVVVWTQFERGGLQDIPQKYYSLEDVADEFEAHDQVQIAVVRNSTAAEMDDEVVSPSSLRKGKLWKMPENFKFTFNPASPQVVFPYLMSKARFRGSE